jgi:hypothetical protein
MSDNNTSASSTHELRNRGRGLVIARPVQQQLVVRKRSQLFHRELLPPALSFWEGEFGALGRGSKGWRRVLCPFHPDRHPSLSVNVESGGFSCFSCGAKGGDLVAFVMLRDGVDFKTAAQCLGAWQGGGETSRERLEWAEQERRWERIRLAADKLEAAERQLRLGLRSEIHSLERARGEMLERLDVLHRGVGADEPDEAEACWDVLSLVTDELREATVAYSIVAFAAEKERCAFVMFPESRAAAISAVLDRGGLIDDAGKWVEVAFD